MSESRRTLSDLSMFLFWTSVAWHHRWLYRRGEVDCPESVDALIVLCTNPWGRVSARRRRFQRLAVVAPREAVGLLGCEVLRRSLSKTDLASLLAHSAQEVREGALRRVGNLPYGFVGGQSRPVVFP